MCSLFSAGGLITNGAKPPPAYTTHKCLMHTHTKDEQTLPTIHHIQHRAEDCTFPEPAASLDYSVTRPTFGLTMKKQKSAEVSGILHLFYKSIKSLKNSDGRQLKVTFFYRNNLPDCVSQTSLMSLVSTWPQLGKISTAFIFFPGL